MLEDAEIEGDDDADERLENEQELALLHEVRLARLVDELGDLAHRRVDRQIAELVVDHQAEEQSERRDRQTGKEQRVSVDASEKGHSAKVGKNQVRFAA